MRALHSNSIGAETAKTARAQHTRRHCVGAAGALLMLAALAGASMLYAGVPVHTSRKYWIGKNLSDAEKEFGTPTFSEQLTETGGMLVIYASRKNPVHFVFETDPGGRIIKAARVE